MKAITCELCGSNDVIKQGEYFICQSCGTKYEPEATKKLVIEIDGTAKLDNLYTLARRAREEDNSENAAKYYGQILEYNSDDWEAYFYSAFFATQNTSISGISVSANSFSRALPTSFELLHESNNTLQKKENEALLMAAYCQDLALMITNVSLSQQKEYLAIGAEAALRHEPEYRSNITASCNILIAVGDAIEKHFILNNNDPNGRMQKKALEVWNNALDISTGADSPVLANTISSRIGKYSKESLSAKLGDISISRQQYDEIIASIRNTNEIAAIKQVRELTGWGLKEAKDYTDNVLSPAAGKTASAPSVSSSNGGGCYVATAVYGSYDCPEVWTLRRYRDYKLSRMLIGRAFIRAYYATSPYIVTWLGDTDLFKRACRKQLDRFVKKLSQQGFENTPYNDMILR